MVSIKLSPENARLLAQNIDGWMDAGSCKGGLDDNEKKALSSAYAQIMRQLRKERLTQALASTTLKGP